MKIKLTALLLIIGLWGMGQGTFYTVNGMNACVFTPASYNSNPTKKYPVIVFMPGSGEIGLDKNKLVQYGPNAYIKQGWDGVANGVEFIVVSFQQVDQYSRPAKDKAFFDFLYANFRVDKNNILGTGLSRGWWHMGHYATYQKTITDTTYIKTFKALVIYEGQQSDDKWDATLQYPQKFGKWAKMNNGYLLAVHNRNSAYYSDKVVASVNDSIKGRAWYFEPLYGNGGHCCWSTHYGGDGVQPAKYNVSGTNVNMYEWFANIVKGNATTPIPPTPQPPLYSQNYLDSVLKIKDAIISSKDRQITTLNESNTNLNTQLSALSKDYEVLKTEYEKLVGILNEIISKICSK